MSCPIEEDNATIVISELLYEALVHLGLSPVQIKYLRQESSSQKGDMEIPVLVEEEKDSHRFLDNIPGYHCHTNYRRTMDGYVIIAIGQL